jgi:hypothetical protein
MAWSGIRPYASILIDQFRHELVHLAQPDLLI